MKGKVAEVYSSIQGEGLYVGERQLFVRFFGCNLACKFCDTRLNYAQEYETDQLFAIIKQRQDGCHCVSFTGGEPLLQNSFLKEILILTKAAGLKNYLETNGTLPEALSNVIDYIDIVAMDLKLPSSTGLKPFWDEHRQFLETALLKETFLKIVVTPHTQEEDFRLALKLIKDTNHALTLVLQPEGGAGYAGLKAKLLKFKDTAVREDVVTCVIPQVHRLLGVN